MKELSVILTVNVIVFSTSTILSWIEFSCNTDFVNCKTLLPSNSREIIVPLSFCIVNAVNWYVPIIEKKSFTFFGVVSNIPSEFDIAPTR